MYYQKDLYHQGRTFGFLVALVNQITHLHMKKWYVHKFLRWSPKLYMTVASAPAPASTPLYASSPPSIPYDAAPAPAAPSSHYYESDRAPTARGNAEMAKLLTFEPQALIRVYRSVEFFEWVFLDFLGCPHRFWNDTPHYINFVPNFYFKF